MVKKLVFLLCVALIASPALGAVLELRIATGSDDAEEHLVENPRMDLTSSDLEMPNEDWNSAQGRSTDPQLVGMRWIVPLDKGVVLKNAYIELILSETKGNMAPVNVILEGQLDPNPPTFTTAAKNISDRPRTKAQVKWTVPTGLAVGDKFQTPDLSPILSELLSQDGWAGGNAIVIMVRDDPDNPSTGIRNAESYNTQNGTRAPLLHLEIFVPEATNPDPADGAQEVTSPLFQWTPGDGAVSHQVYLGTKPELGATDIAGAPLPVPMYFHIPGLTPGVTYYWRVDETAADGTVTAGKVWSFTAMPVTAYAPTPADRGVWQRNDTAISWKAGQGAVSHTVYGGTDKAAVAAGDPSVLLGTQAETTRALSGLTPLTVYYWRVDEVDAAGAVVPGAVWSFHVAGANTGSWRTAAEAGGPGFLATFVQNGTYDIGTFGDVMTYEFIVRSNPEEKQASMALIGRVNFGDTRAGLKYEQWNNTKTYGATQFGVKDHDYKVPNAPGEYTHLIFVASKAAAKTDLYVNGVLQGSIPAAILLSGEVGIGRAIRENGTFVDDFDGAIFGVAIYDRALSDAEITANSAAFLLGGPEALTLDIRIAAGADDAEEHLTAGNMDITSTDLEFPYEDAGNPATDPQLVGLRFVNLQIPKGAQITKAYLEFEVDAVDKVGSTNPVNVVVDGHLVPDAPAITSTAKDLSSRSAVTIAKAKWSVPPWTTVNEKFQTADISAVLQEIIDQEGWASGNALLLFVRDDPENPSTGLREAESFEGEAAAAPLLHIELLIF
jgi:hypothetical protein